LSSSTTARIAAATEVATSTESTVLVAEPGAAKPSKECSFTLPPIEAVVAQDTSTAAAASTGTFVDTASVFLI
jgi:hypothetical protein